MKQSKFTEVQIVKILSEHNQGKTVNEICRTHGISPRCAKSPDFEQISSP